MANPMFAQATPTLFQQLLFRHRPGPLVTAGYSILGSTLGVGGIGSHFSRFWISWER
jgi:hypothetical protein